MDKIDLIWISIEKLTKRVEELENKQLKNKLKSGDKKLLEE